MSDWRVGDLAVCTNGLGWWSDRTNDDCDGPDKGWIGKVAAVCVDRFGHLMLVLDDWDEPEGFLASCFRKICPDEPRACEEEFRILLNLSKKRVVA